MKKTYLFILSTLLCGFSAFSQVPEPCSVDESNNETGVTPEDIGEFCQNIEVNQVIQIAVPANNPIFPFESIAVTIDENTIPDGLAVDCPNNCVIVGSATDLSRACFTIYGTPTTPNGIETIVINSIATTAAGDAPLPAYSVEVEILPTSDSKCVTGLLDFEIGSALSVYPNPSKGNAHINLDMPASSNVSIELFDVIGNKIESIYNGRLNEGSNNISINSANSLEAGMYMLKVDIDSSKGTNTYTERLIVR